MDEIRLMTDMPGRYCCHLFGLNMLKEHEKKNKCERQKKKKHKLTLKAQFNCIRVKMFPLMYHTVPNAIVYTFSRAEPNES